MIARGCGWISLAMGLVGPLCRKYGPRLVNLWMLTANPGWRRAIYVAQAGFHVHKCAYLTMARGIMTPFRELSADALVPKYLQFRMLNFKSAGKRIA